MVGASSPLHRRVRCPTQRGSAQGLSVAGRPMTARSYPRSPFGKCPFEVRPLLIGEAVDLQVLRARHRERTRKRLLRRQHRRTRRLIGVRGDGTCSRAYRRTSRKVLACGWPGHRFWSSVWQSTGRDRGRPRRMGGAARRGDIEVWRREVCSTMSCRGLPVGPCA